MYCVLKQYFIFYLSGGEVSVLLISVGNSLGISKNKIFYKRYNRFIFPFTHLVPLPQGPTVHSTNSPSLTPPLFLFPSFFLIFSCVLVQKLCPSVTFRGP